MHRVENGVHCVQNVCSFVSIVIIKAKKKIVCLVGLIRKHPGILNGTMSERNEAKDKRIIIDIPRYALIERGL